MENEPEIIRQQMEVTRASLSDKVERLENQVVHTMHEATTAVNDTVDNIKDAAQATVNTVKDTVKDTVQSLRESFDIPLQTRRHPWAMLMASVGLGYLGGTLVRRPPLVRHSSPEPYRASNGATRAVNEEHRSEPVARRSEPDRPSMLDRIGQSFAPELDKLKGLAVGTLVAVARDLVAPSMPPQLQAQVRTLFDDVNIRLGGQPIEGPIIDEEPAEYQPREPSPTEGFARTSRGSMGGR